MKEIFVVCGIVALAIVASKFTETTAMLRHNALMAENAATLNGFAMLPPRNDLIGKADGDGIE